MAAGWRCGAAADPLPEQALCPQPALTGHLAARSDTTSCGCWGQARSRGPFLGKESSVSPKHVCSLCVVALGHGCCHLCLPSQPPRVALCPSAQRPARGDLERSMTPWSPLPPALCQHSPCLRRASRRAPLPTGAPQQRVWRPAGRAAPGRPHRAPAAPLPDRGPHGGHRGPSAPSPSRPWPLRSPPPPR